MKLLLRILSGFAAILGVITFAGFLLPSKITISHNVTILSKAEDVFNHINDLKEWRSWMPFNYPVPISEAPQWEYSAPSSGKGAFVRWKHHHALLGNGTIRILESIPNNKIAYVFQKDNSDTVYGNIDITEDKSGTQIVWTTSSSTRNPWRRYMSFFIKGWMLRDIKENLRNLNHYLVRLGKVEGVVSEVYFHPDNGDTVWALSDIDTLFLDERVHNLQHYINNVKISVFVCERMMYNLEKVYHPFYIKVGKLDDGRQILQIGYPVKDTIGYSGSFQVTHFHGAFISTNYIGTEEFQHKGIEALEEYGRINGMVLRGAPIYTLTTTPLGDGPYKGIVPLVVSIQVVQ